MITEPNRRDFIKTLLATTAGVQFLGLVTQRAKASPPTGPMNYMLIMTDQERPPMWFPDGWELENLPNTQRLKQNGLSFNYAFCATAMCTPSRISLFTGLFPAQHHAPGTLTEEFQQTPTEPMLDPSLPNLATCLAEAGYDVVYKGKWHMSHGAEGPDGHTPSDDISRYGFKEWNPPDAGGDTRMENFGGGTAAHDARCINDAIAFLEDRLNNPSARPFFLIVSLVNPHDVLAYPGVPPAEGQDPYYIQGGYDPSWLAPFTPPIPLPPTYDEVLAANFKPSAHTNVRLVMAAGLGALIDPDNPADTTIRENYLNFYGRLMKSVDGQIGQLLDVFDAHGTAGSDLLNQTMIIRTSDHGENGMCHGSLRQKTFVAYEEVLRVPLIWSNPQFFPAAKNTDVLVSHVDLLPTLCALTNVPNWQSKGFAGLDYSNVILDPEASGPADYILFTFDDIYAASDAATFPDGAVPPPNRLRVIRTKDFKYARYIDDTDANNVEEEFYDLRPDGGDYDTTYNLPLEMNNLSQWAQDERVVPVVLTPAQVLARNNLTSQLATLETTRLAPRGYNPSVAPDDVKVNIKRWEDDNSVPQTAVQVAFTSRHNTTYQLEKSTDLVSWSASGSSVPGTGGPISLTDTLDGEKAFYRIQWAEATP